MINIPRFLGFLGAGILLSVAACSKEPPQNQAPVEVHYTSLIRYVPSDTPFLYAFNQALPDRIADHFFKARKKKLQERFNGYLQFHEKRHQLRADKTLLDSEADRLITAVIHHIQSDFSREGLQRLGINLNNEAVLYGYGLIPVFRMRLDEPAVLADTVDSILQEAQSTHTRESTESGWQLILPFGKPLLLMLAVQDKDLVLSLLPEELEGIAADIRIPSSAPNFKPLEKSHLDTLVVDHDYDGYALGFLDTNRATSLLISPNTDQGRIAREAFSGLLPEVPQGCEKLIHDFSRSVPLLHAGTTSVSTDEVSTQFGAQTDEVTGQKLLSLLPGISWEPNGSALGSIGFSANLPVVAAYINDLLNYLEQHQGQCEWVDPQALADYRAFLVYAQHPMIQSLRGALVNFNDFEIDPQSNQPSMISVDAAFFFQSTEQLLNVLKGLSPKLAELDLKPDGNPVHMEIPVGNRTEPAVIAASRQRIAVSLGDDTADSRALALLKGQSSRKNAFIGYAFQGNKFARKFETLDNPPQVQQFLDLMKEQGNYDGVVEIDRHGVSINHHLHLSQ